MVRELVRDGKGIGVDGKRVSTSSIEGVSVDDTGLRVDGAGISVADGR